jgi:hypothetical protein
MIIRTLRALAVALLAAGLAGCFVTEKPLIAADEAVFPYQKIIFTAEDEPVTLTREGDVYVMTGKDPGPRIEVLLRSLGDDLYLIQVGGLEEGKPNYLYAVVKVDVNARTAQSFKAIAQDADAGPGLRRCGDNQVCIDDLEAYLTLAKATIAAGAPPDIQYALELE